MRDSINIINKVGQILSKPLSNRLRKMLTIKKHCVMYIVKNTNNKKINKSTNNKIYMYQKKNKLIDFHTNTKTGTRKNGKHQQQQQKKSTTPKYNSKSNNSESLRNRDFNCKLMNVNMNLY